MDAVNATAKKIAAEEAKTIYETGTILPAQLAQIQSQTAMQNASSAATAAMMDNTKAKTAGQYITNQLSDLQLGKEKTTKAGYTVFGDLVNKASNAAKQYIENNFGTSAKVQSKLPTDFPDWMKNPKRIQIEGKKHE